jgi:hypothetical protein
VMWLVRFRWFRKAIYWRMLRWYFAHGGQLTVEDAVAGIMERLALEDGERDLWLVMKQTARRTE